MTGKTCSICNTWLPFSEFHRDCWTKDGYCASCKTCRNIINRAFERDNREKIWASKTISFHKLKGIVISVTLDELEELALHVKKCQICGVDLTYGSQRLEGEELRSGFTVHSATLDRIDVQEAMTIFNIGIICHQCNTLKSTFNPTSMREFLNKFEVYYANRGSLARWLYSLNEKDMELGR